MPTKIKIHVHLCVTSSPKQARSCHYENVAPALLIDLQHLAWELSDAWRESGGILPHELKVHHLYWAAGGTEKAATELLTQEEYERALDECSGFCEFKVTCSGVARWDLIWGASVDFSSPLRQYRDAASMLSEFAGLDQDSLQWMRELRRGSDAVVEVVIAGRCNSGKSLL